MVFLLSLILTQSPAVPPEAELVWLRSGAGQACDEGALRQAVAIRLGYDPFIPSHSTKVLVEISGSTSLTAHVRVARQGTPSAERVLTGPSDCRSLTDALALALAVAVDPMVLTRVAPVPKPEPVVVAEPEVPVVAPVLQVEAPPAPVVVQPVKAPLETHLSFSAAGAAEVGFQPGGLAGARLGVRLAITSRFSTGLSGWVGFPSHAALEEGGFVDGMSVGGLFDACLHVWRLAGCGAIRGGGLRYQARELIDPQSGWAPTMHAGPRLLFELPGSSVVAVHAGAELWFPLLRTQMLVSGSTEWKLPSVAGGVVLGLTFRAW